MSYEIDPSWISTRTEALQNHIRGIAANRGARPRPGYGNKHLILSRQRFDRYYMQNPDDVWLGIRDWCLFWINSEPGDWALDNIPNIRVEGCIDMPSDSVLTSIHASVDHTLAVEYAMRWG